MSGFSVGDFLAVVEFANKVSWDSADCLEYLYLHSQLQ
jgi:hypothetical protein